MNRWLFISSRLPHKKSVIYLRVVLFFSSLMLLLLQDAINASLPHQHFVEIYPKSVRLNGNPVYQRTSFSRLVLDFISSTFGEGPLHRQHWR
jgi:hypothetical protein